MPRRNSEHKHGNAFRKHYELQQPCKTHLLAVAHFAIPSPTSITAFVGTSMFANPSASVKARTAELYDTPMLAHMGAKMGIMSIAFADAEPINNCKNSTNAKISNTATYELRLVKNLSLRLPRYLLFCLRQVCVLPPTQTLSLHGGQHTEQSFAEIRKSFFRAFREHKTAREYADQKARGKHRHA